MSIVITGRHTTVTPALKRYLEQRVQRLKRYGFDLDEGEFVLSVEKYRHVAEGAVSVDGRRVYGKVTSPQMYESIDRLLEKIQRQLIKNKEKLVERKQRAGTTVERRAKRGPECRAQSGPRMVKRREEPPVGEEAHKEPHGT